MAGDILWQPLEGYRKSSKMFEFLTRMSEKYHLPDNEYYTVHKWSVEYPGQFWAEIWDYTQIRYSKTYVEVLTDPEKMPGAKWFKGARLNFAENLLRRKDGSYCHHFLG